MRRWTARITTILAMTLAFTYSDPIHGIIYTIGQF